MNKIAVILPVFAVISLGIAVYQFIDDRLIYTILSVVYSVMSFAIGRYNL